VSFDIFTVIAEGNPVTYLNKISDQKKLDAQGHDNVFYTSIKIFSA